MTAMNFNDWWEDTGQQLPANNLDLARDAWDAALQGVRELRSEVDCRIQHGAEHGGHLNFVRGFLDEILDPSSGREQEVAS